MKAKQITSILIANRGEIAVRIIKTAKRMGIKTIAVYSQADIDALHVRLADVAIAIGPAPALQSYLSIENIIEAAITSGADAIHPGYGFLSENVDFARACEKASISFVGPSIGAMETMGNKAAAKIKMMECGVDCILGYQGADQSEKAFGEAAEDIGYPLMVKAANGGGGRGIRQVTNAGDLQGALEEARSEALSSFGSGDLILEKSIAPARHIEVQILADSHGNIVHLGERDCSLQRRHQKVIEETPSPAVDATLRERLGEAAIKAAKSVDYVGAGTVEFLLDNNGDFFFLEMNTRLQVEHGVTEMVTGLDLVEWQIKIARGEAIPFSQSDIPFDGHAIEARLYAEDPENKFLPSSGKVLQWVGPVGDNIRVDGAIESGTNITPHYDAMVAKIMAHGPDRQTAIENLQNVLGKSILFGPAHNKNFLLKLLSNAQFARGEADTGLITQAASELLSSPPSASTICLVCVLDFESNRENAVTKSLGINEQLLNWSSSPLAPIEYHYRCAENEYLPSLEVVGADRYQVSLSGELFEIERFEHGIIINGGKVFYEAFIKQRSKIFLNSGGVQYEFKDCSNFEAGDDQQKSDGRILAPMHGVMVEVLAEVGQQVEIGTPLGILEAMKMRHEIVADCAGFISSVLCAKDAQINSSELLFEIESEENDDAAGA